MCASFHFLIRFLKETAAFAIARGRAVPLDIATVRQDHFRCMSFVLVAWGIVADIDFESERFRWMGGLLLIFPHGVFNVFILLLLI